MMLRTPAAVLNRVLCEAVAACFVGHRYTVCYCHWTLLSTEIRVSSLHLADSFFTPCPNAIADPRWDCHGLPVEFEIDKKLSKLSLPTVSTSKPQIKL